MVNVHPLLQRQQGAAGTAKAAGKQCEPGVSVMVQRTCNNSSLECSQYLKRRAACRRSENDIINKMPQPHTQCTQTHKWACAAILHGWGEGGSGEIEGMGWKGMGERSQPNQNGLAKHFAYARGPSLRQWRRRLMHPDIGGSSDTPPPKVHPNRKKNFQWLMQQGWCGTRQLAAWDCQMKSYTNTPGGDKGLGG
eukprot:GGOE01011160.1.p1 GENE.GGOE01011160.1~~GGOE01011160.1.p1  ORF type:complete len:194 (-),score=3.65 GGOE01011160.1:289-870(-)